MRGVNLERYYRMRHMNNRPRQRACVFVLLTKTTVEVGIEQTATGVLPSATNG